MTDDTILEAIQKAVDAAVDRDVAVTVEITEGSFFPSERNTVKITARRQPKPEKK